MIIDCDTCEVRGDACGDCVVGVLLGTPRRWDRDERRALDVLAECGLVPPLRLVGPPDHEERGGDVTHDTPDAQRHAV